MISKLLNVALVAALGFAVSEPLYAADTYSADTPQSSRGTQSTAWSDADVRAALSTCDNWTGTEQAKCIANIRPTPAMTVAMAPVPGGVGNAVKDGTFLTEAEYAEAVKECESANGADKDRCVNTAKEHFGRM
jgi:hypothetical protein